VGNSYSIVLVCFSRECQEGHRYHVYLMTNISLEIRKQYYFKTETILCIKVPLVFPSVFKKNVLEILQKCPFTTIKRDSTSLSGI